MTHRQCAWLTIALFVPLTVFAHQPSDSYLHLDLRREPIVVQWDIALRDLEYALGLDANQDNAITWGELESQQGAIAAYALGRLAISAADQMCRLGPVALLVDRHSDGAYAVLQFKADCPTRSHLELDYRLFFDLDPSHRGLLRITLATATSTAVLSPERPRLALELEHPRLWAQFLDYWREGIWHIVIGVDHILFLFSLLLPAGLRYDNGQWLESGQLHSALFEVMGVVTAFTVAHSLTLALAVLGWVQLPGRLVESAIAATVLLAALNNLYPVVTSRRWLVAFALGLIHGFGFASVLTDLGLPGNALALALAAFNLGVETGQLVLVMGFLPVVFWLRRFAWRVYSVALPLSSLTVVVIAGLWFVERTFDMPLVSLLGEQMTWLAPRLV